MSDMSIGSGIALFVIGAILAFAVALPNHFANLDIIGYILMGAGVIVFLIGLVLMFRKNSATTVVRDSVDPASGTAVRSSETVATPPTDRV